MSNNLSEIELTNNLSEMECLGYASEGVDSLDGILDTCSNGGFSQSGNLLGKIFIPEQRTANLVFGDLNYKTLYIAGDTSLYSIQLNIKGYINK